MKNVYSVAMVLLLLSGCELGSRSSGNGNTEVTGITISAGTPTSGTVSGSTWSGMGSGATLQLQAVLSPSDATGTVTWSTDGASSGAVTVSGSGLVTANSYGSNGSYTVTATVNGHSASFSVNTSSLG